MKKSGGRKIYGGLKIEVAEESKSYGLKTEVAGWI